ncbi:DNA topoisomerase 3-alpha [Bienertia sinuspersici]
MSVMKQGPSSSGCSTNSRRIFRSIVKCKCGHDDVVRSVKNGPNVGAKFYGCPLWPDTNFEMLKWIEETDHVQDLQFKEFEKDITIA